MSSLVFWLTATQVGLGIMLFLLVLLLVGKIITFKEDMAKAKKNSEIAVSTGSEECKC